MKNWYCKQASEAEAIEIVERAVANGAAALYLPLGMASGIYMRSWDGNRYWGVTHNKTRTRDSEFGEQLTIQQVREQFPLPNEVNDMSDKKEWRGPQDGFPPIGFHGEITWGKKVKWVECVVIPGNRIAIFNNGALIITDVFKDAEFRQLRTERDRWVEAAHKIANDGGGYAASLLSVGAIYDAIKSGALKAPEAE